MCNADFDPAAGYFLTTWQVVTSERYWENTLRSHNTLASAFGLEDQKLASFDTLLHMRASDTTAWAVCEGCSEYFVFDRDEARAHARAGTQPGPKKKTKIGEFGLYAAMGYQRVHGHWPANVEPKSPVGGCDFCGKRLYGGEVISEVEPDVLERLRAEGLLDAPVSGPETGPDGDRWTQCTPCLAVMAAKRSRMDRRQ